MVRLRGLGYLAVGQGRIYWYHSTVSYKSSRIWKSDIQSALTLWNWERRGGISIRSRIPMIVRSRVVFDFSKPRTWTSYRFFSIDLVTLICLNLYQSTAIRFCRWGHGWLQLWLETISNMSNFTPRYASISDARAAGENRLNILIWDIELVSEGAVCEFCRVTAAERKLRLCARCKCVQYVKTSSWQKCPLWLEG